MDYFDNVAPRTGPDTCAKCRKTLARHDRLTEVKLVAGVGRNPSAAGQCLYVSETEEYAHLYCASPALDGPFIDIPRSVLKMDTDIEELAARVPDYICSRCKKKFVRGDRVVPVILVEGLSRDPSTGGKAVQCSGEYEMAHYDCHDPQLKGAQ